MSKPKNQEILKYLNKGYTYHEIMKIVDCSKGTIAKVKKIKKIFEHNKKQGVHANQLDLVIESEKGEKIGVDIKINSKEKDNQVEVPETGIKGIMERSDVLLLNHLVERGFLPHHREGIIQGLREHTEMDFSSIMGLYQRYQNLKEGLPTYSLKLNQRLEQVNTMYDATIDFEWVGNRMMGIVKEIDGGWSIMDGAGNHMIKLGSVNESYSISWNSNWLLQPEQLRWAVKKVREIKKRVFNEFS